MPPVSPASSALKIRRALGRLRRSSAVQNTANFFGLYRRRARQRIQRRFIRGTWLHTPDYLAARPHRGTYFAGADPGEPITVPAPTFVPPAPLDSPGGSLRIRPRPSGIAALVRPWVVGHSGAIVGDDHRLLWDLSYEWPGRPQWHTTYHLGQVDAAPLPGVSITLAAMAAEKNYFHFLLNSLARLAYLAPLPDHLTPHRYLISGPVTPFVLDALALFGIPRDRVVGTDTALALRPELLVAPPLVHHPFVVPAHVCRFLRREIVGAHPLPARSRRIFIDRSDTDRRRIANLDALSSTLADLQLERVQLTGCSLAEQAALFHAASVVVANHGAALANLVFCAPRTRVLQILAPGMMEREYRTLSHHGGLHHDYLVAEFATSADAHLPRKDRDLLLAPDLLRRALDAAPSALL